MRSKLQIGERNPDVGKSWCVPRLVQFRLFTAVPRIESTGDLFPGGLGESHKPFQSGLGLVEPKLS